MTVTLMWEARAAEERGAALLDWVLRQGLPALTESATGLERAEVLAAPEDRVLVITWWSADAESGQRPLPVPPADLLGRAPHHWRFHQVQAYP